MSKHSISISQLCVEGAPPPRGSAPFLNVVEEWGVLGVWGHCLTATYLLRAPHGNFMLVQFTNESHAAEWLANHKATWPEQQRLEVY